MPSKHKDRIDLKIKNLQQKWAEERKQANELADQHIQEIQEFGKKYIEKLEKIFEESNEKSARARKKISDNLADLEATRRRLEARQKARELHPLGLDPEDSQILSEILSALFYFFISKKFIFLNAFRGSTFIRRVWLAFRHGSNVSEFMWKFHSKFC